MASQEELIVRIGADFDELKKGLKGATKETEKFGDRTEKTAQKVSLSFSKMKVGALAVVGVLTAMAVALKKVQSQVAENAREQRLWADRLNINQEAFSQLIAVGKQFGATADDMGDSIKDLNERIADAARGNKTYGDALKIIGLNAKDLIKIPIEEQFIKVADAVGKLNNAGDQNFVVAELMADAGFRLLPAMRAGEKGIREMMKASEELGSSFTDEEVEIYREFDMSLRKLKATALATAKPLANDLTIALTTAANFASELVTDISDLTRELRELQETVKANANALDATSGAGLETLKISADEATESIESANEAMKMFLEQSKGGEDEPVDFGEMEPFTAIGDPIDFTDRTESLSEMFAAELGMQQESMANALALALERAEEEKRIREELHNDLMGIDERAQQRNAIMWEMGWRGKMRVMSDVLGSMSVLMQSENRKMFEIGKAAAIANTTITTIESAQKAFNSLAGIPIVGPALGGAAAAAAIAGGIARVSQIQSTTMGGGGGFGGAGGAGATATPQGAQQAPENVVDATFNLQTEQGFISTDQIRGVASGLNEFIEDGGRIRSVKVI